MTDRIPFAKMSGAGNDFLVLDAPTWAALDGDRASWVRAVCRRGLSVGADGVLIVAVEGGDAGRVRVTFFNPDGGEAFCGNGSRCAARYAVLRRGATPECILLTSIGEVPAVVEGQVVSLTLPGPKDLGEIALEDAAATIRGRRIHAGVPHLVVPVTGLAGYPIERVAPTLRRHRALGPEGANVNLVENDASGRVHVRTWERGVENETLACGTGAVAVAFAARLAGAPEAVVVVPRSGAALTVELPGEAARPRLARLIGDARFIFEGALDSDATASVE